MRIFLLLAVILSVAGCGQKGALYQSAKPPESSRQQHKPENGDNAAERARPPSKQQSSQPMETKEQPL